MTRNEAATLIVLSVLFCAGLVARHIQERSNPIPPDAYEESDRLFFERSAQRALPDRTDSVRAPGNQSLRGTTREQGAGQDDPAEKPVDINRASVDELETLPRIGPKTAERIAAFREAYGAFREVDDLMQIRGIGPKTMELLRPLVYIGADSSDGP